MVLNRTCLKLIKSRIGSKVTLNANMMREQNEKYEPHEYLTTLSNITNVFDSLNKHKVVNLLGPL